MSDEPINRPGLINRGNPSDAADPDDVPATISEEEKAERLAEEERAAIPATYVDTWTFLPWRGHIRLVLGESLYRGDYFRAAFVMELLDAERFAKHLLRVVENRKAKDAVVTKEDQPPADNS